MKRISFLVTTLNAGGINNYLLHLLNNIGRPDVNISFVYNIREGDASGKFRVLGVDVHACLRELPINFSFSYTAGKWARNLSKVLYPFKLFFKLQKLRPSILYVHDHRGDILTPVIVCWLLGIRYVLQVHSIESEDLVQPFYIKLLKFFLKKSDVIHFGSHALKNHYKLLAAEVPGHVQVIYYFVDELGPRNMQLNMEIRRNFGVPPDVIVIGFVGRLIGMKHVETIVEAFSMLNRDKYRLVIIGAGEKREMLEKLVEEKGIQGMVFFTGKVINPEYWLNVMDINVLASAYEGQPIAVLECMSKGIVNICSNVTGSKEIIIDNENGLLFELRNSSQLKEKIELIAGNPVLRAAIEQNSVKFYNENFSPPVLKDKYLQLLEMK